MSVPQAVQIGLENHQAGRLAEAERIYQQVLQTDPDNPDALHLLGVIAHQVGKSGISLQFIDKAIAIKPDFAEAWSNRCCPLLELERHDEALASCDKALEINPGYLEAFNNRASALHKLNRLDEAIASCDHVLATNPNHVGALLNLSNSLQSLHRYDEAIACCDRALAIKPASSEAFYNRGNALHELARHEEAISSYDGALAIRCDYADALFNRGNVLLELKRFAEALASYDKALAVNAGYAEALSNRGNALRELQRYDEASASYEKALSIKPELAHARWSLAMTQLPMVFGAGVDPSVCRANFEAALAHLDGWFQADRIGNGFEAVGAQQPFYLAYQEENNRELLSRYGNLCFRLMGDWQRRQNFICPDRPKTSIIRVGIVSSHFCDHSVWHALIKGWLQQLDRDRFEPHLFYLGTTQDGETAFAMRNATAFVKQRRGLRKWVEAILASQPDVLIYPEIGMDPMTVKLASLRLAPVQFSTWGHPETTGLPSIDYFLSAEGLEPAGANQHYAERLIMLPHLGCRYPHSPVTPSKPDLAALGIDLHSPLLICPGAPHKYAPQFDHVLVDIARKLGKCQLLFFEHQKLNRLSDVLHSRLRAVFAQAGMQYGDFVVLIPWQEKAAFYGLMQRADVYLDTIGFSGFNTAMQAVESALPIVTREGRFLRGRFASGILKRLGLAALVAATEDEYVSLAVRLATDSEYRAEIRNHISQSRHVLFEDPAPVKAMENFLVKVAKAR